MMGFMNLRRLVTSLSALVVLVVLVNLSFWLDRAVGNRWLWSSQASEYKLLLDEKGHYVMGSTGKPLLVDREETEISRENRGYMTGNDLWFVNQTDESIVDYTRRPILLEGFATKFSHFPNDMITFKIDTAVRGDIMAALRAQQNGNKTHVCTIETDLQIYRMGYYNGAGARLMDVVRQTSRIDASAFHKHSRHFFGGEAEASGANARYYHSQVECNSLEDSVIDCDNWQDSISWHIPPHHAQHPAITGVYVAIPKIASTRDCGMDLGAARDSRRKGLSIPFIVKHSSMRPYFPSDPDGTGANSSPPSPTTSYEDTDTRKRIIFRTADLTWAAYNKYGGWNLYQGPSSPSGSGAQPFSARTRTVSYNRPYHNRLQFPLGQAQNFLFGSEYPMLLFLERLGYNVVYVSCADSDVLYKQGFFGGGNSNSNSNSGSGGDMKPRPVLLSVGHDEYWSEAMVKAFEEARDGGSHLAFFSGNEMFWRVSWTTNQNIRGGDRLVHCNKDTIDIRLSAAEGQRQGESPGGKEWTGTFVDPQQPRSALSGRGLPHMLTGQYFYVNAYRSDPLRVPYSMSRLGLWRNALLDDHRYRQSRHSGYSYTGWQSYSGVLGYEWDAPTTTLCSHQRPAGIFPLSLSRFQVEGQLVQGHGAQYKGSGTVLHEVTLYRHQPQLLHQTDPAQRLKAMKQVPSGLVFAAGTAQWSWALSDWHDGDHITGTRASQRSLRGSEAGPRSNPSSNADLRWFAGNVPPVDPELQQATMNLLADMGCLPASATHLHLPSRYEGPPPVLGPVPEVDRSAYAYVKWAFSNHTRLKALTALTDFPYVTPVASDDDVPPVSAVHDVSLSKYPASSHYSRSTRQAVNREHDAGAGSLVVKGVASDAGGGRVASVEVSLDYGKTWQRAVITGTGRTSMAAMGGVAHWTFSIQLRSTEGGAAPGVGVVEEDPPEQWGLCHSHLLLPRTVLPHLSKEPCEKEKKSTGVHVVVLSRAVDDSGWIEPVPTEAELMDLTESSRQSSCTNAGNKNVQNNVKVLCLPPCTV